MNRTYLNRPLNRLILLLVLACAAAGCAGPKTEDTPKKSAPAERSADAFAAEALATFQLQRDGARTLNLMAAAAKQAPGRADLAYLHLALCRRIDGCDSQPFETRLRKLDAGNAIVWIGSLENSQRQRDAAVEAQVIDAMSRGERFDVYWNALVSGLTLARMPTAPRLEPNLNETVAWLADVAIPSMQPLTTACSRSRTGESSWAERCGRLARVLMNGDTYLAESLGIAIAKQVTLDPIELTKLDDRARSSRYLWRTSAGIVNSQVERDKFAAEHVELMRKLRREQDVHAAITRWAGRPLTPPADFRMDE